MQACHVYRKKMMQPLQACKQLFKKKEDLFAGLQGVLQNFYAAAASLQIARETFEGRNVGLQGGCNGN